MTPGRPLILHVIPGLGRGGAEHALMTLVAAKRAQPFDQVVVSLLSDGALAGPIRAAGIEVRELGMRHVGGLPQATLKLAGMIRSLRPAAIQSWLYYGDLISYWALRLSGSTATRLYWGVRCSDMDQSRYGASLRLAIRACARRSDRPTAVVANSFAGRTAHLKLGYRPRIFPVIPNGVDTAKFQPDVAARGRIRTELGIGEGEPVLINAARVDPMKDHASLLAVAAALPQMRVVAAGDGTENLAGPPNFMGLGARKDMPALYAAADIAVSTSAFGEGFPNVVAEAMSTALPVVATDTGDTRAIVDTAGTIVAPRDPDAIVRAVRKLMTMPAQDRNQVGATGRRRIAEHFSVERMVAKFDALHLDGTIPSDDAA